MSDKDVGFWAQADAKVLDRQKEIIIGRMGAHDNWMNEN